MICFSLDIEKMFAHAIQEKVYTPLPKFPAVTRDLALICSEDIPVLTLEKAIKAGGGALLEKFRSLMYIKVLKSKRIKRVLPLISSCVPKKGL